MCSEKSREKTTVCLGSLKSSHDGYCCVVIIIIAALIDVPQCTSPFLKNSAVFSQAVIHLGMMEPDLRSNGNAQSSLRLVSERE